MAALVQLTHRPWAFSQGRLWGLWNVKLQEHTLRLLGRYLHNINMSKVGVAGLYSLQSPQA